MKSTDRVGTILVLPNDPLSIYVKQGNLQQFIERFEYYADNLGGVCILNLDDENVNYHYPNIEIITVKRTPFRPFDMLKKLFLLTKLAREKRVSFIRTTEGGTFTKSSLIAIAGKFTGVPSVCSLHGHYNGFGTMRGHKKWQWPLFIVLERITGALTDLVVANSDNTATLFYKHDIPIVPNFVDSKIFYPKKTAKKWDFFYVGSIIPIKGIGDLVEAFSNVRKKFPSARLLAAGHGPLEHLLKAPGITFFGSIKNKDLPKYYNQSKAFITASYQESFGIPLIESQSCGIPVVAYDLPPFREITLPGKTSILVPERDKAALAKAMMLLLKDNRNRVSMGVKARKFIEQKFSKEAVLGRETALIREMLGRRKSWAK